jgi:hypothetical protein
MNTPTNDGERIEQHIRTMLDDTLVHTLELRLSEDIPQLAEDIAAYMVAELTKARESQLELLKGELREYHDQYPDADYNDIMGYIAGIQARDRLATLNQKEQP